MQTIQKHKQKATLSKVYRYDEGVMTRKDWLSLMKTKGATVYTFERRNEVAEEKLSEQLRGCAFSIPFGNSNHPQTIAYNKEKQRLKDGIFITEYRLQREGVNYVTPITKTEFNYFNSL